MKLLRSSCLILSLSFICQFSGALAQPSFDCSRATRSDEFAICYSDILSKLDNIASNGYMYLRSTLGIREANRINSQFIQMRISCGSDHQCIKNSQILAIKTFQYYGAPIDFSANDADIPRAISSGQGREVRITLMKSAGTYAVPVLINGLIPLNFIIDSGAADVAIPADVVLTLIRTGSLTTTDFIGSKKYQLADGSVIDSNTFLIRSLKVGTVTVPNVQASIADVKGGLLLGQSFLEKFRSWSLDNQTHELVLW